MSKVTNIEAAAWALSEAAGTNNPKIHYGNGESRTWTTVTENFQWLDDRDMPFTIAELEAKAAELNTGLGMVQLRNVRNDLLKSSDWTQGEDVPTSIKTPWATYRQSLRDITDTATSLEDVTWPTKPE